MKCIFIHSHDLEMQEVLYSLEQETPVGIIVQQLSSMSYNLSSTLLLSEFLDHILSVLNFDKFMKCIVPSTGFSCISSWHCVITRQAVGVHL